MENKQCPIEMTELTESDVNSIINHTVYFTTTGIEIEEMKRRLQKTFGGK